MTKLLLFALFCAFAAATQFHEFKRMFNRQYKSLEEEQKRFQCFQETLQNIEKMKKIDKVATYSVNKFSDLCAEEFRRMYTNLQAPNVSHIPVTQPTIRAPADEFDWRSQGAVNPVKNQQACGSCWAFSAVAAMEGAWKIAKGNLVSLSEEELVQCAPGNGCGGGWPETAIQWVIGNGGINSEAAYPYTSGGGNTGSCDPVQSKISVASFSAVLKAPSDENGIASFLVQHGPLSIAVDASDWQSYANGVKTACYNSQLNHGVAIVGYGTDGATPYWIVRNSWGETWGESGYVRLQRGVNCNSLTSAVVTAQA